MVPPTSPSECLRGQKTISPSRTRFWVIRKVTRGQSSTNWPNKCQWALYREFPIFFWSCDVKVNEKISGFSRNQPWRHHFSFCSAWGHVKLLNISTYQICTDWNELIFCRQRSTSYWVSHIINYRGEWRKDPHMGGAESDFRCGSFRHSLLYSLVNKIWI